MDVAVAASWCLLLNQDYISNILATFTGSPSAILTYRLYSSIDLLLHNTFTHRQLFLNGRGGSNAGFGLERERSDTGFGLEQERRGGGFEMEEDRSDAGFRLEQERSGYGLSGEERRWSWKYFFVLRILGQSLTTYCI